MALKNFKTTFSFSFFEKTKEGWGRPYMTYPLERDLIGAPPAREC